MINNLVAGCPGSTCLFDLDHVWPHIVMKTNQKCKSNVRSNAWQKHQNEENIHQNEENIRVGTSR